MRKIYLLIVLCISNFGFTQENYPKNYFDAPLKIPIILSGTFGELRSNHFHSGVDIKTLSKEGIPIHAPADGYVSRIKISQYGYGKALYLKHPNGYSTVYGHLKKYNTAIQEYVRKIQYKKKNYQTGNIFPKQTKFPVKKGEIIGYTGNSGSSGGPHLHYEIRNTATERVINPMHFGLDVKDSKTPTIKKLMAFPLDELSRINNTSKKTLISIKKNGIGNYVADSISANGYIGFGVHAFDQLDEALNKNGLYSLEMKLNGQRVYYHDVETFSFVESKYINLLIDYEHYGKYKTRLQKTHKDEANKLSIYEDLINNGKLLINEGFNYDVAITAKDFKGNESVLKIPITGVNNTIIFKKKDTTAFKVTTGKFAKFSQENVTIAFPKNTFYHDAYLDFEVKNNIAKVHEPTIPLNKKFTLTFDTTALSEKQKEQVYIANFNNKKYPYYVSTKKKKNKVYTSTKNLGRYTLKYDNKKPIITLVNFKANKWISALKELKVKIKDNETGVNNWRATIDGDWILMEYNHKRGVLTYNFSDKELTNGRHEFKIIVFDNVGNSKTKKVSFFRKK